MSRQIVAELIEMYRSEPCLWQVKSVDYHNRDKKDAAYLKLAEKLRESEPGATKKTVVAKINNLRSTFRREKKKVEDSTKSGAGTAEVYNPSLWYFDLLEFLRDQDMPRMSTSNMESETEELKNKMKRQARHQRRTFPPPNIQPSTSENSMASPEESMNEEPPLPKSPQKFLHEEIKQVPPAPPVNNFTPQRLESYKLIHNNHLHLILESLAKDESFMDVTLTAQSMVLKAHKSVLSAVSPYFRKVLKETTSFQRPIIIMPRDVKYQELCSIINYIYKGEVTVPADDLCSLLKTADILQITGLSSAAEANAAAKNNLSNVPFQTPILLTQPIPASFVIPTKVEKTAQKQNVTETSQDQSIEENSDSDANRIDPLDFISVNTTCIKQEIVTDFEEEIENSNNTKNSDPIPPVNTAASSPLQQSSNLNQSTTSSTMEDVPAANTGDISSNSPMDTGNIHDADTVLKHDADTVLKGNIGTTTTAIQPSKEQPQTNVSEAHENNTESSVSGHTSTNFKTAPFVCPYCLESHKPISVLQTHLRLKHQSKPYFVCKCARVFARPNHLQDHTQFCSG